MDIVNWFSKPGTVTEMWIFFFLIGLLIATMFFMTWRETKND